MMGYRLVHRMGILVVLAIVAGCAATSIPPRGERVPIRQLLAETAGRNYECAKYDAATDSCEALARYSVSGDRVRYDATVLASADPRVVVAFGGQFQIEGDRVCGSFAKSRIKVTGDIPADDLKLIEDFMREEFVLVGDVCSEHYRAGDGYISRSVDRAGKEVPDGTAYVQYFAEPKPIRPATP